MCYSFQWYSNVWKKEQQLSILIITDVVALV